MSTQNIMEELRDEGRLIQARSSLHRVLEVRKLAPSPSDEAQIDACTDIATLERWFDVALTAKSAADVLRAKGHAPGQTPEDGALVVRLGIPAMSIGTLLCA